MNNEIHCVPRRLPMSRLHPDGQESGDVGEVTNTDTTSMGERPYPDLNRISHGAHTVVTDRRIQHCSIREQARERDDFA